MMILVVTFAEALFLSSFSIKHLSSVSIFFLCFLKNLIHIFKFINILELLNVKFSKLTLDVL